MFGKSVTPTKVVPLTIPSLPISALDFNINPSAAFIWTITSRCISQVPLLYCIATGLFSKRGLPKCQIVVGGGAGEEDTGALEAGHLFEVPFRGHGRVVGRPYGGKKVFIANTDVVQRNGNLVKRFLTAYSDAVGEIERALDESGDDVLDCGKIHSNLETVRLHSYFRGEFERMSSAAFRHLLKEELRGWRDWRDVDEEWVEECVGDCEAIDRGFIGEKRR